MKVKGTTRCKNSAYKDTEMKDNGVVGKIANSSIRLENLGRQRRSSEDLEVHELDHRRSCVLCRKECGHVERFEAT